MIIQCAQCKARFRLDDSKVSDVGIKVRCSKCKHIFVVKRDAPVEEGDLDMLLQGLDSSPAGAAGATVAGMASAGAAMNADQAAEAAKPSPVDAAFSSAGDAVEESSIPAEVGASAEQEEVSFGAGPTETEKSAMDFEEEARSEEPFGSFELEREDSADVIISDESDFSAPDSGIPENGLPPVGQDNSEEEEISFGEVSPEAFAAATDVSSSGVEGAEEEEISFEFEEDDAADYGESVEAEESAAGDFDFGEIDFGIEDAGAGSSHGDDVSSVSDAAVKPESESVDESPADAVFAQAPPLAVGVESEPPPLSIASRRKGRSFLPTVVIALSVLVIVALAGFGFYFFKEGPESLNSLGVGFLSEWFGMEIREEGTITLDKVSGAYHANSETGEVFVIRGEAVNNYRKSRAAIQVRGALLGAGGQAIVQKVAYCGNSLTDE
ncbi:MAG: DUF3426 domain-containing protein, partial [Deltaproteobacteria bacterium]|nr:DUF3426 domain-containing protein [Deltaproteobacteria bacterium]